MKSKRPNYIFMAGSFVGWNTTVPCSSMKPFGIFLSTEVTRAFLWFLNLKAQRKKQREAEKTEHVSEGKWDM